MRHELDSWSAVATRFRDQLLRVADSNGRPLESGTSYVDVSVHFGPNGGYSEDPVLRDISAEAHNELFTSPTDLVRAERLVTEFGNRLATS